MPEQHFHEYAAYYRAQPFGHWREDFRFAYLLAAIAGMLGGQGQTPADFMPFYPPADPHVPQHALQQAIEAVFPDAVVVQAHD